MREKNTISCGLSADRALWIGGNKHYSKQERRHYIPFLGKEARKTKIITQLSYNSFRKLFHCYNVCENLLNKYL